MSSVEFTYQLAAARLAPWGEAEADRRAALIATEVQNWSGFAKRRAEVDQSIGLLAASRESDRKRRQSLMESTNQSKRLMRGHKRRDSHR